MLSQRFLLSFLVVSFYWIFLLKMRKCHLSFNFVTYWLHHFVSHGRQDSPQKKHFFLNLIKQQSI